jgi:hypothetical protein
MDVLLGHEFNKCVNRYQGYYRVNNFSCCDQFLCMAFAQLTYRESLCDLETGLRALQLMPERLLFSIGVVRNASFTDSNLDLRWYCPVFPFYNDERLHAALDYLTPTAVYAAA